MTKYPEFFLIAGREVHEKLADKMRLRLIVNLSGHNLGRSFLMANSFMMFSCLSHVNDFDYFKDELDYLLYKY